MFEYTLALAVTFILRIQASSVIVKDPGPRHVISPVGSQFQLNCSVARGNRIIWAVFVVPVLNRELLSDGSDKNLLQQRGITVRELNNHSSQLVVNPTTVELVNYIECIAQDNTGVRTRGQRVNVTIYGPPSPPTDVMLTPLTVNSLRVSWSSPPTPPGVALYFNLTIFNLNSSEPVLMKTDIQTQHYIFTDNNRARPCDVYNFHVTARNDAGIGNSSEIVTGSLPSLPDISAVEDSLQHSLAKANGSVTLRVQFNEAMTCPDYPVMKYTLVLEDSEGNRNETSLSLAGNVSISGLMENVCYIYYIVAVNSVGNSTSSSRSIIFRDNTTGEMVMCPSPTDPPSTPMSNKSVDAAAIVVPVVLVIILLIIIGVLIVLVLHHKGFWDRDKYDIQVKAVDSSQHKEYLPPHSDPTSTLEQEVGGITLKGESETAVYSVPYKKSSEMKVDSTLREPSSVNAAQSEAASDPVYNKLSSNEKPAGGNSTTDSAAYSSLNQGPIYQVLEKPEEKGTTDKRISADPTAPPVPSGEDSSIPQIIEYAEINVGTVD